MKLPFSWAYQEILGCSIIFLVCQHFLSFSLKNACLFATINFCALYLAFLYDSLLMRSLIFLNALKSLSLNLRFWSTSPSNQFWILSLTQLVLVHHCQWKLLIFERSRNTPDWHLQNIRSLQNLFSLERFYKHQLRNS